MSKCVQICTVESLGDASDFPGYLRRYDDKLWFSDGTSWIEISGKIEKVAYGLTGSDVVFIADKNFVITNYEFLYPINESYGGILVNGTAYVLGDPIYYGDVIRIFCDEYFNTLCVIKEYFDIPVLNLQPKINYNFPTTYISGQTYMMAVGIRNVSNVPTTLPFQFYVQKLDPIASFVVDENLTEASSPLSGYLVSNSNFTILEQATRWRFTSNSDIVLNPLSTMWIGFQIIGDAVGNGTLTVTVVSGTGGGENPTTDNIITTPYIVQSI